MGVVFAGGAVRRRDVEGLLEVESEIDRVVALGGAALSGEDLRLFRDDRREAALSRDVKESDVVALALSRRFCTWSGDRDTVGSVGAGKNLSHIAAASGHCATEMSASLVHEFSVAGTRRLGRAKSIRGAFEDSNVAQGEAALFILR